MHPFSSLLAAGRSPPAYIGVTTSDGVGAAHNVNLPAGSAVGDLAVVVNGFSNAQPTGFTLVRTNTMANNGGQYYQSSFKVLTSTDISNGYIAFPSSGLSGIGELLIVYRGVREAVFAGEFEGANGDATLAVTYALNTGSLMTVAYAVDRDGSASGFTLTGATKVGAAPASGGIYGVMWGHNLLPIANSTVITFGALTTGQSGIVCVLDLRP